MKKIVKKRIMKDKILSNVPSVDAAAGKLFPLQARLKGPLPLTSLERSRHIVG